MTQTWLENYAPEMPQWGDDEGHTFISMNEDGDLLVVIDGEEVVLSRLDQPTLPLLQRFVRWWYTEWTVYRGHLATLVGLVGVFMLLLIFGCGAGNEPVQGKPLVTPTPCLFPSFDRCGGGPWPPEVGPVP